MDHHFCEQESHVSMSRRAFIGAAVAGGASVVAAEAVAQEPVSQPEAPSGDPLANLSPEERIEYHVRSLNEIVRAVGTPEWNGGKRFDGVNCRVVAGNDFTIYLAKTLCS